MPASLEPAGPVPEFEGGSGETAGPSPAAKPPKGSVARQRLQFATVLVELNELYDAEAVLSEILEEFPEWDRPLELLAKIKHMHGKLSAAIACWAQALGRTPQYEAGHLYLSSLLQLARDPERGAGEFLALGQFQLWRKPAAHMELEEAFRLFLARRVSEAAERCEALAGRYKGVDQNLYKLSVLALAWFAEMSGDLGRACEILEQLGTERGFETDTDRAFSLARVYERLATPESLEKAVTVCRFLERSHEGIPVQGHLAMLYRALGRDEEAEKSEKRFLKIFRKRMHRPSPSDLTEVAARCYIPLDKLARIRFPRGEGWEHRLDSATHARDQAIRLAIRGAHDEARRLLSDSPEAIDTKYLGDLARFDGFLLDATRLYLQSLEQSPDDSRVIEWLLLNRQTLGERGARLIDEFFSRPAVLAGTYELLDASVKAMPLRPGLWRQLHVLHRIAGRNEEADLCARRADTLSDAARLKRTSVGRVLAAAVYHFVGKARGLIHEVWAERKPTEPGRGGFLEQILGNVTPEMSQSLRNTFMSVREYARAKFPHRTTDILDYDYTFKITKEDEPSSGLSGGLPSALAFLSVFLNEVMPQDIALSGAVITDAHDVMVTSAVGEVEFKVGGAYNRNLRMLILPEGNRKDLLTNPRIPAAICDEIVRFAADLDEAVNLVFGERIWVEI